MTTNPAESLFAACELAQRALSGMYAAGADKQALEELACIVAELKAEHDLLPQKIHDEVRSECSDCPHAHADTDPACIGAAYQYVTYECEARTEYQCPVVRACGYRDPSDPLDSVPNWLKVQAS